MQKVVAAVSDCRQVDALQLEVVVYGTGDIVVVDNADVNVKPVPFQLVRWCVGALVHVSNRCYSTILREQPEYDAASQSSRATPEFLAHTPNVYAAMGAAACTTDAAAATKMVEAVYANVGLAKEHDLGYAMAIAAAMAGNNAVVAAVLSSKSTAEKHLIAEAVVAVARQAGPISTELGSIVNPSLDVAKRVELHFEPPSLSEVEKRMPLATWLGKIVAAPFKVFVVHILDGMPPCEVLDEAAVIVIHRDATLSAGDVYTILKRARQLLGMIVLPSHLHIVSKAASAVDDKFATNPFLPLEKHARMAAPLMIAPPGAHVDDVGSWLLCNTPKMDAMLAGPLSRVLAELGDAALAAEAAEGSTGAAEGIKKRAKTVALFGASQAAKNMLI